MSRPDLPVGPADLAGVRHAVLILNATMLPSAAELAAAAPDVEVRVLAVEATRAFDASTAPPNLTVTVCRTITERVAALIGLERPDLLIESGNHNKGQKLACFRELFLLLNEGGRYVVDRLDLVGDPARDDHPGEDVLQLLRRLDAHTSAGEPVATADRGLAEAISSLELGTELAVITKTGRHLVKLRDDTATAVLIRRHGDAWGAEVASRPAYAFTSRATVTHHGDGPLIGGEEGGARVINVPRRVLRRYEGALVHPRQRVEFGDYLLPDTFRHLQAKRLSHHMLRNASTHLDAPNNPAGPSRVEQLEGDFFYLDAEYPGHFGHVTSEVLSRFWGWAEARLRVPHLRPLLSLGKDATDVPTYQRQLFAALDIPTDDVAVVPAGAAVEVERLWAATPGFSMPHYADLALAGVWEAAARALTPDLSRPRAARLFVSRRGGWRPCHNQVEVEEHFRGLGFEVIYPEDHPMTEQVAMFRRAKLLAGFGGSSMFTSMFAPGTPRILVNGDSNTATNEFLFAAVLGAPLHYFWGESDLKHPPGGWDVEAFHAPFSFDLAQHGPALRRVVEAYA